MWGDDPDNDPRPHVTHVSVHRVGNLLTIMIRANLKDMGPLEMFDQARRMYWPDAEEPEEPDDGRGRLIQFKPRS